MTLHSPPDRRAPRATRGFSLIELMVVVAVVAILAAVAYPSYASHVERARRAEVRSSLMEAAQFMERFYSATGSYASAALPQRLQGSPAGAASPTYSLTLVSDAASYTLTATPVPPAGDVCGALVLTHTGVRTRSGSGLSDEGCWR